MKKKNILPIAAITFLALSVGVIANAYQGDYTKKGPLYSPERHEAMEKAFAERNYEDWKNLMNGRGRVNQIINKDNFPEFVEAHKLAEEGKYEEADKIREKLGLRTSKDGFRGGGYERGRSRNRGFGQRGRNWGGNFVDKNNDGICDMMQ